MIEATGRLVDYHLEAGNYEAALFHARRLLLLDPWREEAHRNLMLLLMLGGDFNAALQQYEECRASLAAEMGIDPCQQTETLHQNIRKQMDGQDQLFFDQPIRLRAKIDRVGDLVSDMYFSFQIPDIYSKYVNPALRTYQYEFQWVNYIGCAILSNVAFFIGGQKSGPRGRGAHGKTIVAVAVER